MTNGSRPGSGDIDGKARDGEDDGRQLPAEGGKTADFCSMCGPHFC
jgi:hypothetical protein